MPHTNLVPPLYEARGFDWIRHHIERTLGITRPTLAECDEAAGNKRCPSFAAAFHDRDSANVIRDYAGRVLRLTHDPELEAHRMARLRIGHLRYGVCGRNLYDAIGSTIFRLGAYIAEGNREHLVDALNLIEIEWIYPNLDGAFWDFCCDTDYPQRHRWSTIESAMLFLDEYLETANRRALVLAAILVTYEWQYPTHASAHFEAQDCGGHWSLRNQVAP